MWTRAAFLPVSGLLLPRVLSPAFATEGVA